MNHLVWYLFFAGIAAHATLVWLHFTRMWNAEHFQYFPVAIAAAGVLGYSRRHDIVSGATIPRTWLVWIGLGAVVLVQLFSCMLGLALTSWLCFIAFLVVMLYAGYGWGGVKAAIPVVVMLLIIKPVPTFLEQFLTINMQKGASVLAGNLLNLMGVLHYRKGVVLSLIGQSFLTEEACSGIRSLFSSLAAITFLGLMNRYHWLRHAANIIQTIMWVIVLNAFRIAMVVYVEDQTSFSIASGWVHDAFGYLIFFAIFGLVLSTDRLFAAIVVPTVHEPPENPPELPASWTDYLVWPGGVIDGLAFASLFGLVAILSFRMLFLIPDYKAGFAERLPAADRNFLPEELKGWQITDFQHVRRTEHDFQGAESFVWELTKDKVRVTLSLDGSFKEFHDLAWCYSALGWQCKSDRLYSTIAERSEGKFIENGEFTHIELSKNTGETGHVLFSAMDRRGLVVVPPPNFGQETGVFVTQAVINSLRFALGMQTTEGLRAATFEGPVSTIQLVYIPQDPITEEELEELKSIFLASREQLRNTSRFLVQ